MVVVADILVVPWTPGVTGHPLVVLARIFLNAVHTVVGVQRGHVGHMVVDVVTVHTVALIDVSLREAFILGEIAAN